MKEYPDRREHMRGYMEDAAAGYLMKVAVTGEQITQEQTEEVANRAIEAANIDYEQQCIAALRYNTGLIEQRYRYNLNRIKRESARTRYWLCPLLMVVFGVLAVFGYVQADPITLWTGVVAVLVQVAFLVGFALFDKPVKL